MLQFALTAVGALANALPAGAQDVPPLAASGNVQLLGHVPDSAARDELQRQIAYVSGRAGITVLTSPTPTSPQLAGSLALPHFENEDAGGDGD